MLHSSLSRFDHHPYLQIDYESLLSDWLSVHFYDTLLLPKTLASPTHTANPQWLECLLRAWLAFVLCVQSVSLTWEIFPCLLYAWFFVTFQQENLDKNWTERKSVVWLLSIEDIFYLPNPADFVRFHTTSFTFFTGDSHCPQAQE